MQPDEFDDRIMRLMSQARELRSDSDDHSRNEQIHVDDDIDDDDDEVYPSPVWYSGVIPLCLLSAVAQFNA